MIGMVAAALLAAGIQLPPQSPPAPPLRLATGVAPETVTVGDRFRAVVRLQLPPGARVIFPAMAATDTIQQVDSVRVLADPSGSTRAAYTFVAWIAGITPAVNARVEVLLPDGRRPVYRVALRLPYVRSVLPADTAGVRPKPPGGLLPLPPVRAWWRPLLLGLAVLAALASAWWLLRRARRARRAPLDPRRAALARLDALRTEMPDGGEAIAPFYADVVRVLRVYLATLDARWGEQLTSTELVRVLGASGFSAELVAEVDRLLAEADPVKFACAGAGPASALVFWSGVRQWIERAEPRIDAEEESAA